MKKCDKCNFENPDGARFCSSCGARLPDEKKTFAAKANFEDNPLLAEFVKLLKNPVTRKAAAESLGNMGQKAAAAVPELKVYLNDDDAGVRIKAAAAIKKSQGMNW